MQSFPYVPANWNWSATPHFARRLMADYGEPPPKPPDPCDQATLDSLGPAPPSGFLRLDYLAVEEVEERPRSAAGDDDLVGELALTVRELSEVLTRLSHLHHEAMRRVRLFEPVEYEGKPRHRARRSLDSDLCSVHDGARE